MVANITRFRMPKTTHHGQRFLPVNHSFDIHNNFPRVIIGYLGAPPSADALSPIDQYHGYNWNVPFRFYSLIIILQEIEKRFVVEMEDISREVAQLREDITRAGSIFAALEPGAELTDRPQQVDVV